MNKRKGSVVRKILWLMLIAALIGWMVYSKLTESAVVETVMVRKGEILEYIEEKARTALPNIYHLTMPQQGRVLPIALKEGDEVGKDQVLVQLEDLDWKDALVESNAMVTAMKSTVEAAMSEVKASALRAEYSKWLWDQNKRLYDEGFAVSEQLERESRRDSLVADVELEEDRSNKFAMEAMYAAAKLLPIYVTRQLKRTELKSPANGVVLKRFVWNEKVMQAGEPLLDIGELDRMELISEVLTEEAVRVAVGDRVQIYGETVGEKDLLGVVHRVKPAGFTKVSSLGVEQQRVEVVIYFESESLNEWLATGRKLGLNYRMYVRIVTDSKVEALVLPRAAIFRTMAGEWQVYVVDSQKRAVLKTVQVGLKNDREVEVIGLTEGERVIMAPDNRISDGVRLSY